MNLANVVAPCAEMMNMFLKRDLLNDWDFGFFTYSSEMLFFPILQLTPKFGFMFIVCTFASFLHREMLKLWGASERHVHVALMYHSSSPSCTGYTSGISVVL